MYFKYYFSKSSSLHFKKKNHFVLFWQFVLPMQTHKFVLSKPYCSFFIFDIIFFISTLTRVRRGSSFEARAATVQIVSSHSKLGNDHSSKKLSHFKNKRNTFIQEKCLSYWETLCKQTFPLPSGFSGG